VGGEAPGLVDDQHDIVFVKDFERNVGGSEIMGGGFFRSFKFNLVTRTKFVGWFDSFAVH
jgi:hypothetical protein